MVLTALKLTLFYRSVRIFEGIKDKAQNEALYSSVVAQLKPTIDELGLSTPEELGLNKACMLLALSRSVIHSP